MSSAANTGAGLDDDDDGDILPPPHVVAPVEPKAAPVQTLVTLAHVKRIFLRDCARRWEWHVARAHDAWYEYVRRFMPLHIVSDADGEGEVASNTNSAVDGTGEPRAMLLVPSTDVELAWSLHVSRFEEQYREFCMSVVGRYVRYVPSAGLAFALSIVSDDRAARSRPYVAEILAAHDRTRRLYVVTHGRLPRSVWGWRDSAEEPSLARADEEFSDDDGGGELWAEMHSASANGSEHENENDYYEAVFAEERESAPWVDDYDDDADASGYMHAPRPLVPLDREPDEGEDEDEDVGIPLYAEVSLVNEIDTGDGTDTTEDVPLPYADRDGALVDETDDTDALLHADDDGDEGSVNDELTSQHKRKRNE